MYDAVIFDFDGTLADTAEDVWRSVEYAAARAGGRVSPEFRACARNLALPRRDIWREIGGGSEGFGVFERELDRHYVSLNAFENTSVYPGVVDLLEALRRDNRELYVVTNKAFRAADKLIRLLGLAQFFRAWYSPDGPGGWNLSKSELLAMLMENELSDKVSVYVGDSYGDVEAARANGMPVIGALYGDGDPRGELSPDYLAESAAALFPLLLGRRF
ncbi:MAG: HAD family hydrolase [Clostridiales bacterium]|jgi:phosphoglycolate phosphatase|nr:HAD family hydrolase [Clostridiales bacterium]